MDLSLLEVEKVCETYPSLVAHPALVRSFKAFLFCSLFAVFLLVLLMRAFSGTFCDRIRYEDPPLKPDSKADEPPASSEGGTDFDDLAARFMNLRK